MAESLIANQFSSTISSTPKYINLNSVYRSGTIWQGSFTNAKYGIFLIMARYSATQDYGAIAQCNVNDSVTFEYNPGSTAEARATISLYDDYVALADTGGYLIRVSAIIYYE